MYDIIYNPQSGKGKSKKAFDYVLKTLDDKGEKYVLHATESHGHATEIVRELNTKQDETNLIVLGGDGTFNEVLNGIENFDTITLGCIPCGTGNDYVKAAHIPSDPKNALDTVLTGRTDRVDFIQLDGRRCINVAGAGMDVDVLVRFDTMKFFKGKLKYYASLIDTLIHLRFHKTELTVNGETSLKNVFLIAIGNGIYIGGGMPVCPNAVIDDGKLDIVCVNEIKPSKVFALLLKFLKGKHIDEACTETYRVEECTVRILDDGKTQVDGEVLESKELHCKVVPKTLKIYR